MHRTDRLKPRPPNTDNLWRLRLHLQEWQTIGNRFKIIIAAMLALLTIASSFAAPVNLDNGSPGSDGNVSTDTKPHSPARMASAANEKAKQPPPSATDRCSDSPANSLRILLNGRLQEVIDLTSSITMSRNTEFPAAPSGFPIVGFLQGEVARILVIPCEGTPSRYLKKALYADPERYVISAENKLLDKRNNQALFSRLFALNLIEISPRQQENSNRNTTGGGGNKQAAKGPDRCLNQLKNSVVLLNNGIKGKTLTNKELLASPLARTLTQGRHEGSKAIWLDTLIQTNTVRMRLTPCKGDSLELTSSELQKEPGRYYLTPNKRGAFKFFDAPKEGASKVLFRNLSSIDLLTGS